MGQYDDIIHLPHHCSEKRSHMSRQDRAAQFSPFAALIGFDSAIEETSRLTDFRPELADYRKDQLDHILRWLTEQLPRHPRVSICRFVPDSRKSGGHCETIMGRIRKIDLYRQCIVMTDGTEVMLSSILIMESPDFREENNTE